MTDDVKDLGAAALAKVKAAEPKETKEPTPAEAEAIRSQKKARLTQVLTRGVTGEKLNMIMEQAVPKARKGKFVRDTEEDILRYKNLGFDFIYSGEAKGLHGTANNRIKVGDVVLMTIDREDQELLREVRHEKAVSNLSVGKREYLGPAKTEAERGGAIPFDESNQQILKGG